MDNINIPDPLIIFAFMRKAWYGINALIVLLFNGLISLLHVFEVFPYFHTLFYALFCLLPLLVAIIGIAEKDENKIFAWIALVISAALLCHWLFALLIRSQII